MGQGPFEDLRWQVLVPQRGGRWKLYLTAAPRKCCSSIPLFPATSCMLWHHPQGFHGHKTHWSCWKSSLCLPCLHLEPALHKLYERQEGQLLPHTPITGRGGCSTAVPVPTKPPVTPRVHLRKSTQHVSEITRSSIPQPGCLLIATLFSQRPPRS